VNLGPLEGNPSRQAQVKLIGVTAAICSKCRHTTGTTDVRDPKE